MSTVGSYSARSVLLKRAPSHGLEISASSRPETRKPGKDYLSPKGADDLHSDDSGEAVIGKLTVTT